MNYLLLFTVAFCILQASQGDSRNVTIVVVEYHPNRNPNLTTHELVLNNSIQYVQLSVAVRDSKPDMIIFPEATLRNNPQTAEEITIDYTPCSDMHTNSTILQLLSCTALDVKTYLVANLVEKETCNGTNSSKNCLQDGFFYYNTDVVFDRNGTIINRYRKYNLFGENELDRPPSPDQVVISTDFGAKYGIFTCFDILFKSPAQDLLNLNIDGVIFPTMWFSELPFLTALQTQQMWAHEHNVKFFSAGANDPSLGSGGSGFFSGDQGMILSGIQVPGGSQAFVYKYVTGGDSPVDYNPQEPSPYEDVDVLSKQMDDFQLLRDSSVDEYTSTVLDTSSESYTGKLCHENGTENQICCEFSIKISVDNTETDKNNYVYHLVAFSGVRSFSGTYNGGIELCAIIACLDSSLASCGQRFSNYDEIAWPITFEDITIKANFDKSENRTQFPNSLLSSIRPINASQTIWEAKEVTVERTVIERKFSLKEPQNRILTFAIYGRKFEQDSPPENEDDKSGNNDDKDGNSSATSTVSLHIAVFSVFFCFLHN